jgi:hypothetical protein
MRSSVLDRAAHKDSMEIKFVFVMNFMQFSKNFRNLE